MKDQIDELIALNSELKYILTPLKSIITVSVETMKVVYGLPALNEPKFK